HLDIAAVALTQSPTETAQMPRELLWIAKATGDANLEALKPDVMHPLPTGYFGMATLRAVDLGGGPPDELAIVAPYGAVASSGPKPMMPIGGMADLIVAQVHNGALVAGEPRSLSVTPASEALVRIADVDGDGVGDLVIAGSDGNGAQHVIVLRNER